MSSRQDRQAARTPADLERKYNFGSKFSEVMDIATDARNMVEDFDGELAAVEAELTMKVGYDENDQIVRMINDAADILVLNANRLVINSSYFSLTQDGKITSTSGDIGKWDITESGLSKYAGTHYYSQRGKEANTWVYLNSPTSSETDIIKVECLYIGADIGDVSDDVLWTPLAIKANGDIYTEGMIKSSNMDGSTSTVIDHGTITIENNAVEAGTNISYPLMEFKYLNRRYGVFVVGTLVNSQFVPQSIEATMIGV